ncbi:unnamed protein product [Phytomonas sp. EM1]|nr:unnamed protein product [Phytomonas sp. EM1]|eukprot:CCW63673.1 unnamed protein product [Phytomonas sp. isolate EM1]
MWSRLWQTHPTTTDGGEGGGTANARENPTGLAELWVQFLLKESEIDRAEREGEGTTPETQKESEITNPDRPSSSREGVAMDHAKTPVQLERSELP